MEIGKNQLEFNKIVWWSMDRDELFMKLDKYTVKNGDSRTIASVVDRDPVGILGNSIVYRVSSGSWIGVADFESPEKLLEKYQSDSTTKGEPMRISLPTDGVYAQALMDECVACEEHFGSTDWVLADEDPDLADFPSGFFDSRQTSVDVAASEFPDTNINIANAPAAPAVSGFGGVLGTLGSSGAFNDMTGLEQTQLNAAAAMNSAAGLANSFGERATRLAVLANKQTAAETNAKVAAIKKAEKEGTISSAESQRLTNAVLENAAQESSHGSGRSGLQHTVADVASSLRPGQNVTASRATPYFAETVSVSGPTFDTVRVCSFLIGDGELQEETLRNAIVAIVENEHDTWTTTTENNGQTTVAFTAETDNARFRDLVCYWLRCMPLRSANSIRDFCNAIYEQNNNQFVIDLAPAIAAADANNGPTTTPAAVLDDIMAVLGTNNAGIRRDIDDQILKAMLSRRDSTPWSAAFISSVVREATITHNLEPVTGRRDHLLRIEPAAAHKWYTEAAHMRRFGSNSSTDYSNAIGTTQPFTSTYQAFSPADRTPQIGDIIVQDRRGDLTDFIDFNEIPGMSVRGGQGINTHGDIIVEVNSDNVVAIGGNIGNTVKRRRYPLASTGMLSVSRTQGYVTEGASGLAAQAAATNANRCDRIFALLSPVPTCRDQRYTNETIA